ncbi:MULTISPECIES: mechanosensitive ion channel family protein [Moorena]|uniref:Small-conductance mechanosensitive channel n=1 Tax=Moorena producens 3L TaxID=489825 RepID=F4XXC4_9CYAN|nr:MULTISPECIES: mechanosensitive ion channel family protein [Moorena]EGJ30783.1 small-conductance mechanosensitive channel [Moorena producens 3L]NEP36358.1 mechanosensitive ion channel family protein [Moorena sp. SIO3B2]NEP65409.1 mechanosensitive ion channel family protein [Moorena sp. SIO3A5]NEQ05756.1 mechanosensitive ion channel family protein [Moorena sp. SIO4E2]NER88253.1 mechanosensitive ion channel family protein [Moorena sp. SIO3A2]
MIVLSEYLKSLAILGGIIAVLYVITFVILPPIFRRFSSDAAITSLKIIRQPLLLFVLLLRIQISLIPKLKLSENYEVWVNRGLTAAMIAIITYVTAQILTKVILYYLKKYSEQTEAMWDDVLLPILQGILPILVYVIGGSLFLQTLGINVAGVWVALGGASFILGFAFKDSLANFLSGLVLLVDTPFQFGDVILLSSGQLAVIKKVGLRVTHLYVVSNHSDVYLPNSTFETKEIVNLTRPTPHYYDQLELPIMSTVDPGQAIQLIENVILAHPDTMGLIDRKLELLEKFYGFSKPGIRAEQKRKVGLIRLKAEQKVNHKLEEIENAFDRLSEQVDRFENEGLEYSEIRIIQGDYLNICEQMGLSTQAVRLGNRQRKLTLEEGEHAQSGGDSLIGLVREWYNTWCKDPDLLLEDHKLLRESWEQKITILKRKANQLWLRANNLSIDDTRFDDVVDDLIMWLQERFKRSRIEWQNPKIWMEEIKMVGGSQMDSNKVLTVKFFVDDIKLEHCERGNRVKNELYRELIWQLRQAYLAK